MEEVNKIKEMNEILIALDKKDKLDDRRKHILNFVEKSKYLVFDGYHNKSILTMFYSEILDYFHEKEGNAVIICDGRIIGMRKTSTETKETKETYKSKLLKNN